jgi:hypothetical protein
MEARRGSEASIPLRWRLRLSDGVGGANALKLQEAQTASNTRRSVNRYWSIWPLFPRLSGRTTESCGILSLGFA